MDWNRTNQKINYYIHKFVFDAIKDVIPDGFEIKDRNAVKNDNRLSNLELVTHKTKY